MARSKPEAGRGIAISKALSLLLRHAAEKEGVKINAEGYANVADVLAWRKIRSLQATFPEILDTIAASDKKRFALLYRPSTLGDNERGNDVSETTTTVSELESATAHALSVKDLDPTHFLIRATQGHTIKNLDLTTFLEPLSLSEPSQEAISLTYFPTTVVHGTYHGAWPMILRSGGLQTMGRNHIHFATGPSLEETMPHGREGKPTPPAKQRGQSTVISGMRWDTTILIYIDIKKALTAGCPFWRSENGVILSEGIDTGEQVEGVGDDKNDQNARKKIVPLEFFDVVVERGQGLGILWENGKQVQELPSGLASRKNPKDWKGNKRGKSK
ncbi:RNA 2'-phosphotransferase, Tpt1 / KptA family domain containing protein [Elaphomyces granulatus]